jgi:hypothetical protein
MLREIFQIAWGNLGATIFETLSLKSLINWRKCMGILPFIQIPPDNWECSILWPKFSIVLFLDTAEAAAILLPNNHRVVGIVKICAVYSRHIILWCACRVCTSVLFRAYHRYIHQHIRLLPTMLYAPSLGPFYHGL